jgi:Na+/glutamate symporter
MDAVQNILLALGLAVGLSFLGELLRSGTPGLRRILLPGSVLGGITALVLGPQLHPDLAESPNISAVYDTLALFPPLFITVVFACLMLDRPIAKFRTILSRAGPQIVIAYAVSTFGILSAAVFGPLLATVLRRKGQEALKQDRPTPGEPGAETDADEEKKPVIAGLGAPAALGITAFVLGVVLLLAFHIRRK